MARNLVLLYENFADAATFSGGAWRPSMDLSRLATPYLGEVARSTGVSASQTQFVATLSAQEVVGGLALGPVNATTGATIRIRAYRESSLTTVLYDSGTLGFPGAIEQSLSLEWEDNAFWTGVVRGADDVMKGITFFHIPPELIGARYWRFEINDVLNPAGFIEIGRLFIGRAWSPEMNYAPDDNGLSFEFLTDEEEGRGGTKFFNPRAVRRVFSFGFPYLRDTAFRDVFRIATRAGRHNQVVVVPSPDDLDGYQREAMIGTIRQAPSLRRLSSPAISTSFVVEESL
ncbi:hypothetical protein [Methylobacterium sp. Leaf399]|uniref:hypothetical protein n=1 Tax=Methylobacterium sp. Leaf399 TaxID=1736364 RepID=UPI000A878CE4|nr:hypothetical protein [Methylobacterium sp. Leaf399]